MCLVAGFALLGLGLLFIALSLAGAVVEVWKDVVDVIEKTKTRSMEQASTLDRVTALITSIKALWDTVQRSPKWLVMFAAGAVLSVSSVLLPAISCTL